MDIPTCVLPLLDVARDENSIQWQAFRAGIDRYVLYGDPDQGPSAALLRYQPGAGAPLHRHTGYEHIILVRGSQRDQHGLYTEGSVIVNPPGSEHWVASDDGCLALLIWERPVVFLDTSSANDAGLR